MSAVHLRAKGWITSGERIDITPQAFADAVVAARELYEVNARLDGHSKALISLLDVIKTHGTEGEEFTDAYRQAVRAVSSET